MLCIFRVYNRKYTIWLCYNIIKLFTYTNKHFLLKLSATTQVPVILQLKCALSSLENMHLAIGDL